MLNVTLAWQEKYGEQFVTREGKQLVKDVGQCLTDTGQVLTRLTTASCVMPCIATAAAHHGSTSHKHGLSHCTQQ